MLPALTLSRAGRASPHWRDAFQTVSSASPLWPRCGPPAPRRCNHGSDWQGSETTGFDRNVSDAPEIKHEGLGLTHRSRLRFGERVDPEGRCARPTSGRGVGHHRAEADRPLAHGDDIADMARSRGQRPLPLRVGAPDELSGQKGAVLQMPPALPPIAYSTNRVRDALTLLFLIGPHGRELRRGLTKTTCGRLRSARFWGHGNERDDEEHARAGPSDKGQARTPRACSAGNARSTIRRCA